MTTQRTRSRKAKTKKLNGRTEYRFNYRKSRPNRFASRLKGSTVAIVLDPDVAAYFDSSELVNTLLRSVIAALPDLPKSGG